MPVAIYIILSVVLLWLVSGGYVFYVACVRRKENPWFDKVQLEKTSCGKYYNQIVAADKFLKDHGAQDVTIRSFDGLALHALWVPADNPRGTVLAAHGYRSTPLVDFGLALEFYHDNGMNLLIPDQRAHGRSEGRYITFGVFESTDMRSWIRYHNEKLGVHPLILSGLSMGATTVMNLADEKLPDNVKGIIADCGFTSPKAIIGKVIKDVIHLPAEPLLISADWFARVFAGFSLSQKDTRKALSKNRLPILMVHGLADDFVPSEMTVQSYNACAGNKKLLLVEGAGHGVSFLVDRVRYGVTLRNFLESCIGGRFFASKEEYDG